MRKSVGQIEEELKSIKETECNGIIHGASAAAAACGGGLAQIPGSDTIPITGIQITMIVSLGIVFDIRLTESAAKALLSGFAASVSGRAISQFLVGWIPGWGNALNASTAAALTEAIGWSAVSHFAGLAAEDILKGADYIDEVLEDIKKKDSEEADEFATALEDVKNLYRDFLILYKRVNDRLDKNRSRMNDTDYEVFKGTIKTAYDKAIQEIENYEFSKDSLSMSMLKKVDEELVTYEK